MKLSLKGIARSAVRSKLLPAIAGRCLRTASRQQIQQAASGAGAILARFLLETRRRESHTVYLGA